MNLHFVSYFVNDLNIIDARFRYSMYMQAAKALMSQLILREPLPPEFTKYIKTCLRWPLKNRQNKDLNDKRWLMKVESIAECNTFNLL